MTKTQQTLIERTRERIIALTDLPDSMPGTDWNPRETKANREAYLCKGMADQLHWSISGGAKPQFGAKNVAIQSSEILARKLQMADDARATEEDVEDSRAIADHDLEFVDSLVDEFNQWVELYEMVSGGKYQPREYKVAASAEARIDADIAKKLAAFG